MFKVLILALACCLASAASAQESAEQNAAPEPYAYAYQTDTHQAAEQRGADGKVTGYYTIVDPTDGRERRVEYEADEGGFRAKVATNELGTKAESPADVQMFASPPTEAQLVYQAPAQQQQVVKQQQVLNGAYVQLPQAQRYVQQGGVRYVQQPYGYNQLGYGYNQLANYQNYYYPGYGYAQQGVYGGYSSNNLAGYNYQAPGQYLYQGTRYVQAAGQPAVYSGNARLVQGGLRTVPVANTGYTYGPVSSQVRSLATSSGATSGTTATNLGSGNLLLLKKK